MLSRDAFLDQSYSFLEDLWSEVEDLSIEFPTHWHVDHICYRSTSDENYKSLKTAFSKFANLLVESPVNGRLISTFQLQEPYLHGSHAIRAVELPQPKKGSTYKQGCEHIELVCDIPLDELPKMFPELSWEKKRQKKYYNDEIKCQLKSGVIKFHNQSLESVITLEKNAPVYKALVNSKVLTDLARFQPLVVGTFPLGLHNEASDIDIVLSHTNLQEIEESVLKYYSHLPGFKMNTSCTLDRDTVTAKFLWEKKIPFGLFAQKTSSFEQNGYRHFSIEERLLKIHGDSFRDKVVALRNKGLKTEPAFAKVLELKGDAYKALLELYFLSDKELGNIF